MEYVGESKDLSFVEEVQGAGGGPMKVNYDNQGAIVLAKDIKFHSWTKHIELWYYFIQEAVQDNKIMVSYISTEDNVSDIFTKSLAKSKFQQFLGMLGLRAEKKGEFETQSWMGMFYCLSAHAIMGMHIVKSRDYINESRQLTKLKGEC